MSTELAKAYVQIVPSADGIQESLSEILGKNSIKPGEQAGTNIANSIARTVGTALSALAIGKVVGDAITAGNEYQTAMAKLGTIADYSAISIDGMKGKIEQLSNQLGVSQKDLADAAYATISATGDTAGSLGIVEQAAKLAKAGFTDTESAISVLTTSLNAYGLSAQNVDKISDSLIATQNLGVTTVAELASNMGRAIATASGYSVSLENLEASYIATTKSGISTAESTTYISSMLAELGKNGSKVSDIIKSQTGTSFAGLMKNGSSLSDVLKILTESVDGDAEAFMNLWGSQEAGKAANAIVNQGLNAFNENLKTLQTQSGITETAFGQMSDTFAEKSDRIRTKFENIGIKLFESMYPVIEKIANKVAEFVDNIDTEKLSEDITEFANAAAPAVDMLGGALALVGKNIDVIIPLISAVLSMGVTTKIIGMVTGIMKVFTSIKALTPVISALTGPVGVVIAVVASLAAGLVTLYKTNEKFRNIVNGVWNGIKNTIRSVVTGVVGTISTGFNNAVKATTNIFGRIRTTISSVMNGAKSIVSSVINAIKSKFNFSWKLPKLKMPHLSITGGFSIVPPKVPKFSIKWYDKGGIFDRPSIIGVGEKRPEFVGALDDLRVIVREEAAASNASGEMKEILSLLKRYMPEATASRQVVLDTGALVGQTAYAMDRELGRIASRRGRGR